MTEPTYHIVKMVPEHDLGPFDCGEAAYNDWLTKHAASSVRAGSCAVYLLLEAPGGDGEARVVGYYAINPAQVARGAAPTKLVRGWPDPVPAWRIGKLALHRDLRGDHEKQWGRQLLRHALETIVRVAGEGGGKVIVVDADNSGLIDFYTNAGFRNTGAEGDLSLYMKVSTARKALAV